jgi:hypothetical protein
MIEPATPAPGLPNTSPPTKPDISTKRNSSNLALSSNVLLSAGLHPRSRVVSPDGVKKLRRGRGSLTMGDAEASASF